MSEETSTSPPPPSDAAPAQPSPLTVGKMFLKQYYQVLSTTPDQIHRFYQPTASYLSDATGSNATDASTFTAYGEKIATRWGEENKKMRIELENGAIDAQPSVNGSILLVVTGHVSFLASKKKSAFVHTFFLATMANSRRFYVHNDVLRFLTSTTTEEASPAKTETEQPADVPKKEEETPAPEPTLAEEPAVESKEVPVEEEAPGGGVEESKEVAPEEEEDAAAEQPAEEEKTPEPEAPVVEPAPAVEEPKEAAPAEAPKPAEPAPKENSKGGKKGKGRGRSPPQQEQQQQPKQQPAKPATSTWASLVASGGGAAASTPVAPSPAKPAPTEKATPAPEAAKAPAATSAQPDKSETANGTSNNSNTSSSNVSGKKHGDRPKRDPDCTLVIKNLGENAKDSDLRALFERFATQTKANIVGTTVSSHRGLGFVDYDAVAPVLAAVEFHAKEPIHLNGRKLEVDQKTAEQRARRNNRGGYNRSGSPGNNNNNNNGNYRGGGGGGRGQYNRRGGDRGGRGDRSGGGGGRGGRGGR